MRRCLQRLRMPLLVAVLLVAYASAYTYCRSTQRLIRYSNANHWHPGKRTPGHFIGSTSHNHAVELVFGPLIWLEQSARNQLSP